jgi:hypothetical protein
MHGYAIIFFSFAVMATRLFSVRLNGFFCHFVPVNAAVQLANCPCSGIKAYHQKPAAFSSYA